MPRAQLIPALGALIAIVLAVVGQPFFSDENATARNLFTYAAERTLVPGHFQYGPLYSYLAAPFAAVGIALDALITGDGFTTRAFIAWFAEPLRLAYATRIPAALAAVALLWVLLQRARRSPAPLLGTVLVIALITWPPLVRYAGLAVPDTLVALLCVLALAAWERGGDRRALMAGALVGLAFAAKATALSVGLAWIAAPWLEPGRERSARLRDAAHLAAGFTAGWLIGAPSWLFEAAAHARALLDENRHVRVDGHLGDWGPDGAWLITRLLPYGALFLAAGVGVAIRRRAEASGVWRQPWIWGVAGAALLLWGIEKKSAQYLFPLLATGVFGLLQARTGGDAPREEPTWARVAAGIAISAQLALAVLVTLDAATGDGRADAERRLREALQPGDLVWLAPDYGPRVLHVHETPWAQRPHVPEPARPALERAWSALPIALIDRARVPHLPGLLVQGNEVYLVESDAWSDRFLGAAPPDDFPRLVEVRHQQTFYEALRSEQLPGVELLGAFGDDGITGAGNVVRIWRLR